MLQRLDGRHGGAPGSGLALLSRPGPRAGLDARHAAMAEVIAWSWNLLPPALQHTLAAVTVFVGGFTAEAAAAVVGADAALQLDEAVQHSLLTAEWQGGQDGQADETRRFRFTEPVREFALERLLQQQPAAAVARLRRAHRDWWPRWIAQLGPTVPLAAFRAELPNLVAALASAEADGEPEAGVRLALALRRGFAVVPLTGSGIDTLQRLLASIDDAPLRSAGLGLLAVQEYEAGLRERAERHAEQALDAAPPESVERARALQILARLRWTAHNDRDGASRLLDEAEPLAERLGERALLGTLLAQRAYAQHLSCGRPAEAERLFERQRALLQGLGNRHDWNAALYHRVNLDYQLDRYADSLAGARELAERARAEQDWTLLSKAGNVLGGAHAALRQWRQALPCFLEAVEVAWADGAHFAWAYAMWNAPTSLLRCGQAADAARLMAFAAQHWTSRYGELSRADLRTVQRQQRLQRTVLGARRAAELAGQGRELNPVQAMQALRRAVTAATQDPPEPRTPPRTGG
jgi:tetratricopeptide (TPR) repeat protein